ncbi:hypothetical protein PQX77_018336 [Marasmius sp. AFHP31]|nr:hypothetical protein PQX77_018336 [Marasmius sp. AFHP31]
MNSNNMNALGLDRDFLVNASKKFSSPAAAINALRRIKPPPSVDLSTDPPLVVQTALEAIGSLAFNMQFRSPTTTSNYIKSNWASHLHPWVVFLVDKLILSEDPKTVAGWDALGHALSTIPFMIRSPFSRESPRNGGVDRGLLHLESLTPGLNKLFVRVWYKALDQYHPTWRSWTLLFASLTFGTNVKDPFQYARVETSGDKEELELGMMFVRHINRFSHELGCGKMDLPMLEDCFCCTRLMSTAAFEEATMGPLQRLSILDHTLPALTRLLSLITHKRTRLMDGARVDREPGLTAICVFGNTILGDCEWLMVNHRGITEALRSGIVVAILKAEKQFYTFDDDEENFLVRFTGKAVNVLNHISRHMMYQDVLHLLTRDLRTVSNLEELEGRLKLKSPLVWATWRKMREKASWLHQVRTSMRTKGLLHRCTYSKCTTYDAHTPRTDVQYLRCTGCWVLIYCSQSCQKRDWKENHRQVCQKFHVLRTSGNPFMPPEDSGFLREFIDIFAENHASQVTTAVRGYVSSLARKFSSGISASMVERLIAVGEKLPIVIFDFDGPDIPSFEKCVQVVDPETLQRQLSEKVDFLRLEEIMQAWASPLISRMALLVVCLMPKREKSPWAIHFSLPFPVRLSEKTMRERRPGLGWEVREV